MNAKRSDGVAAAIALATALCANVARAQTTTPVRLDEEPASARTLALGGRAEATASSTASLFANPASILAARGYHTDVYGLYDPTTGRYLFGSALTDSTRQYVSAGLGYYYQGVGIGTGSRSLHDTRINVTVAFTPNVGIGLVGKYLNATGGPPLLNGSTLHRPDSDGADPAGAWAGFTFDAGVFVRPAQILQLTVSGHNLTDPQTTVAPIQMGGGIALMPASILTIVADVLLDFRQVGAVRGRYSGGVELFLGNHFPIRVGYAFDHLRLTHAITGGIGYMDENFGVEFGIRQAVAPDPETTMMLSVRYFYRGATQ